MADRQGPAAYDLERLRAAHGDAVTALARVTDEVNRCYADGRNVAANHLCEVERVLRSGAWRLARLIDSTDEETDVR